jgi:hypothetical protein
LEDAITFYTTAAFANSPAGGGTPIPLTPTEIDNIGAFLRVINAAFNVAISIQRLEAAADLENRELESPSAAPCTTLDSCGGPFEEVSGKRETVNSLLALANVEAADAIEVLTARGLHASAVAKLNSAISKNNQAIDENSSFDRFVLIQGAYDDLNSAKAEFGTGLNFTLGEGNLLF